MIAGHEQNFKQRAPGIDFPSDLLLKCFSEEKNFHRFLLHAKFNEGLQGAMASFKGGIDFWTTVCPLLSVRWAVFSPA